MFRIKHIPTGLYFQPHKHRGNHLSKIGKIYATMGFAKAGGCSQITLRKNGTIHKLVKPILGDGEEVSWSYGNVRYPTIETDWEIEKVNLA